MKERKYLRHDYVNSILVMKFVLGFVLKPMSVRFSINANGLTCLLLENNLL